MTKLLKKPVGFVLTQTLNVPKIVRFRLSLAAALPRERFEHPLVRSDCSIKAMWLISSL
jgi:hypothetical protein